MKKFIALLLALVITAGTLAACAAGAPSGSSSHVQPYSSVASVPSSSIPTISPSPASNTYASLSTSSEISTGFLLLEETSEGNVYRYTNTIENAATQEELLSINITVPLDWTNDQIGFNYESRSLQCWPFSYTSITDTTFDAFLLDRMFLPHYMPPMVDSIKYYLPETYEQANGLSVYTYLTELHWWDTGTEYRYRYYIFIDADTVLSISFRAYEPYNEENKSLFGNIVNSIVLVDQ